MKALVYSVFRFCLICGGVFSLLIGPINTPAFAAKKSAAMAIDAHTGRVLYSHNIDKPHHPASLTKVMTLYMLFEFIQSGRLNLDSKLQVTENASRQQPSKLGLKPGTTIRVEHAIKALIVKSANDVAVVVAENIAGSEWKFAQLMTWKARKLGMNKTRFLNASGLPNRKQVTTARDMIKLSQAIQKDFPGLYRYFATKKFAYKGRVYKNYNRLMSRMQGIDGIKTGYTRASGFNLTSSYWQGRKHVVAVVMGGKTARRRDVFMAKILRKSVRKASRGKRKQHIVFTPKRRPAQKQIVKTQPIKEPIRLAQGPKIKPEPQRLGAGLPPAGPYHIQIGAFGSEEDAKQRLASIGSKAGSLLTGHQSFTMLVPNNNSVYRARFAGFTEQDARQTCRQLKRKAIDCLAVPAQ